MLLVNECLLLSQKFANYSDISAICDGVVFLSGEYIICSVIMIIKCVT
jgi:hypothetical protein